MFTDIKFIIFKLGYFQTCQKSERKKKTDYEEILATKVSEVYVASCPFYLSSFNLFGALFPLLGVLVDLISYFISDLLRIK